MTVANHSREWHDKDAEAREAENAARDAWRGPDHDRARELDRKARDLRDEQRRMD